MKKMLALILALMLILSLAACGGGDDEKTPSNDDKTPSSSQQQQQTQTSKPGESEQPDESQVSDEELIKKANEIAATFGSYNGTSLVWNVLTVDTENEKALLLTEKCIDIIAFHESDSAFTWESSEIRAWLIGEFYDDTFGNAEKALILETINKNPANSQTGVAGCDDTTDRVFLLSEKEALEYFETDDERIAETYDGDIFQWWLRTPGDGENWFMLVNDSGGLYYAGSTSTSSYGIRPAIWVNLSDEQADPVEDEPDNNGSEEATDPGTSGSAEGSHELFDIEELMGVSEFPDFAKKAIGTLSWCDDLSRSMPQYEIYYNAYMKNVTQEDFETYIANLNANAPKDPVEGEEFVYYWDWGQIIGTYHPADGILDVGLAIYEE